MSIKKEFDTVKQLAEYVLSVNKEARNSDTVLYAEMCKMLGAKTVDDISKIGLNMITVHKIRQVIQNKEGKYLPDENVKEIRRGRSLAIKDYMAKLK